MSQCLNCDNVFEGNYCNRCGQKASVKRFTLKNILHDIPHQFTHLDKGVFLNIKSVIHPGKTVFAYLGGKRVGYYSPVLFTLISLGALLFAEHLQSKSVNFEFNVENSNGVLTNVGSYVNKGLKYFYFVSVFLFALPTGWLFKSKQLTYAEHVVANLFIMGYVNMVYLPLTLLPQAHSFPLNPIIASLFFIFTFAVFYTKGSSFLPVLVRCLAVLTIQFVLFFTFIIIFCLLAWVVLEYSA